LTAKDRLPLRALLETAHILADVSGKAIMPKFRKPIEIENKAGIGDFDPVTVADKAAERVIRRVLRERHPNHGILGEEYGTIEGTEPYTWVIDPIDGTKAFITGAPLWGTLIGVLHESRAIVGMMHQPFTQERIWSAGTDARKSAGTTQWSVGAGRAKVVKTRACRKIEDALLATTSPDLIPPGFETERFQRLKSRARLTRYGGDCYAYCLLAGGYIDLVVECGLKAHDVVALIPIIEGAGGRITTWEGERAEQGGRIVAAGDPKLHDAALKVLSGR
jgi:histidinol phosphatase-like enzyme (inositol monophosphatase family)